MKKGLSYNGYLHLMLLPAFLFVFVYQYIPMFGLVMAFQQYVPTKGFFGSEWVGLQNFYYTFSLPGTGRVFWNTVFIALMKIVVGLIAPICTSLLLNEISKQVFKRGVQTIVYLPHFLSWTLLGGILIDILSPSDGIVNQLIQWLGFEPIFFLGNKDIFPYLLVVTNEWKEFGFSTIIYLAALTSINPALYEAAVMDGANRLRQTWHITLPGMRPIIVLLATLSMSGILNAGFEQVFNLYNPLVYETGDIIDTYVYRMGILNAQYSNATTVGLLKSIISFVFISVSYYLAYRFARYRIF
ncbi:ABC transporter permease [Paenibacillus contaminans]|uniref:Sugar ABC transporter permease n=1 Tax=Paenibacillus contaminans TaxID=450362 RepID=A0A329MR45_9BACL|nr:ABC transporter permease subunit [Paenibacillus contaminans]RAV22461.1 sugar ABC transporter permease [Paenibacillus contaminans]